MGKKRPKRDQNLPDFLRKYARKHGKSDPNDRQYSRKLEEQVKRLPPEKLDRVMRGEDDEVDSKQARQQQLVHCYFYLDGQRVGEFVREFPRTPGPHQYRPHARGYFALRKCVSQAGTAECYYDGPTGRVFFMVKNPVTRVILEIGDCYPVPRWNS